MRIAPDKRRPAILEAAFAVFLRHGYFGASMDEIAAEAGVSKPVVYACFATKEELFLALLAHEEQRVLGEIAAALPARPDLDPRRALEDGLRGFLAAVARNPDAYRLILLGDGGVPESVATRIRVGRRAQIDAITGLVDAWARMRDMPESPDVTRLVAYALVGATEGAARAVLSEPERFDPQRTAEVLAALMTGGERALRRPPSPTPTQEHEGS
jgi:AcrR family transcriptional regulator